MKILFDVHCHTMSLARPAIGRFVDAFLRGGLQSFFSQVAAPGYILNSITRNGGETLRNLLAVVENDPAELFALIEDDLAGAFLPPNSTAQAVFGPSSPSLFGEDWDAWLVCPLMMDFGARSVGGLVYYSAPPKKTIDEAVREMLAGISGYRAARPEGRLIVRPFLGLDPGARGAAETERALYTYFSGFSRRCPAQLSSFKASSSWKGDPGRVPRGSFAGIKLYPPLGFDPWPEDRDELDAARLMYDFCERRGIPLVVHCDDQGFRTIPLDQAMHLTDPERWLSVFKEFPDLIVDFAHFGERYLGRANARGEWTKAIIGLMERFSGVYADVAFNGCEAQYWTTLSRFLEELGDASAGIVRSRLLFGTDFVINLMKTRSYRDYVSDFIDGSLDSELKRAMISDNPARFLFGDAS
ncbi:MAG: hypothetical protein A2Y38_06910 [Spirochaetes bacterium GWB1_59_5]|nr:MAG: hypothetical protein A2Y38_06910 [Spirochaetes bacterium GWB1_59_5]